MSCSCLICRSTDLNMETKIIQTHTGHFDNLIFPFWHASSPNIYSKNLPTQTNWELRCKCNFHVYHWFVKFKDEMLHEFILMSVKHNGAQFCLKVAVMIYLSILTSLALSVCLCPSNLSFTFMCEIMFKIVYLLYN